MAASTTVPLNQLDYVVDGTYAGGDMATTYYLHDSIGQIYDERSPVQNIHNVISWTPYGKVDSVMQYNVSSGTWLMTHSYLYDAMGNQVQDLLQRPSMPDDVTYHIYDGHNTQLAVYHMQPPVTGITMEVAERYLYGSERLGYLKGRNVLTSVPQSPYVYADNSVIVGLDKQGEGFGYSMLKFLAQQGNSAIAVSANAGVSYGVGASLAKGMAVDAKGNFALFYGGSLPTLGSTLSNPSSVGFGANIHLGASILPGKDVTSISGAGVSIGGGGYSQFGIGGSVAVDFSVNSDNKTSFQGFSANLGIGTPGVEISIGAQAMYATIFSQNDYKTLFDSRWDRQ